MKLEDIREKKVKIEIGDKTRHLRFDMNAFAELEQMYGSVEKAIKSLQSGNIKSIINILWAGLIHEDAKLTPKAVGKMFDLKQINELGELIGQAIKQAVPDSQLEDNQDKEDDSKNEQSPIPANGIGPGTTT